MTGTSSLGLASTYSVKIINPKKQGGIQVHEWATDIKFTSVMVFRKQLEVKFQEFIDKDRVFQFGYIIPGHGVKGKQKVIETDEDLQGMYTEYKSKKVIVLWLKTQSPPAQARKRSQSSDGDSDTPTAPRAKAPKTSNQYSGHLKKMEEVESIVDQLEEKHAGTYTPEQLRAWAHMVQLKKHDSLDIPPKKPFFGTKKPTSATVSTCISPGKKINMRSELIDQLDKWHRLMDRGAITEEQYKDLQETILGDIKKY